MNVAMKSVSKETITKKTTADTGSGEVTFEEETRTYLVEQEPAFVKIYLDDIVRLYHLPLNASTLLHALMQKMDYGGLITLMSTNKKRIAEDIGIKLPSVNNQITALVKADVLKRTGRCEYMFNPKLLARGQWKDIKQLRNKYLELTVSYNLKTGEREVSSTLTEGKEE